MEHEPSRTCSSEDIQRLIESRRIATLFQPVVSIERKNVVGFEAFSRGRLEDDVVLGPAALFDGDLAPETRSSLDGACCSHSLSRFRKFLDNRRNLCLFLNLDARVLDHVTSPTHFLSSMTRENAVPPGNVVVEVSGKHVWDNNIPAFFNMCRDEGYQLSVDRVGRELPVLDVLFKSRPHYIKLDRSVWSVVPGGQDEGLGLDLIVRACQVAGCRPIAIGVENEEDALRLLESGLFLHQGYYYTSGRSKGEPREEDDGVVGFLKTVEHVHARYTELRKKDIVHKRDRFDRRHKAMQRIVSRFATVLPGDFENHMKTAMASEEDIVSMFILDARGVQITDRPPKSRELNLPRHRDAIRSKGRDHSMTDYHLYLQMGYDRFVNQPLGSPFLPRQTTIIALRFFSDLQNYHVLCIEFDDA